MTRSSLRNRFKRELSWWYRRLLSTLYPAPGNAIRKTEIAPFLPESPIIIEAGAYKGIDTEEMSRLWPNGHIYTFEPVPELYHQVLQRVGYRKNVECYNVALGAESGTTSLYVSTGASDASSSIRKPGEVTQYHPDITFDELSEVPVTTLHEFVTDHEIQRVDFLWLDLQGAEFDVLRASPGVVQNASAIYTEVNHVESYEGTGLYPDLRGWLADHGFEVQREFLPWEDQGNVLFVKVRDEGATR